MNNEELKKKIAQIIADYFCPQRNEHKNLWGDDRLCYSKMNFAECERVTECTDALIKAGIGDVKDLQVQVDSLEITNIALQAGYDDAEKDRLYWVDKYKEAEHRADKAKKERDAYKIALRKALKTDNCAECFSTISVDNECFTQWGCDRGNEKCINTLFKQAEKELAEEWKE